VYCPTNDLTNERCSGTMSLPLARPNNVVVELSSAEREQLDSIVCSRSLPHSLVCRAGTVLMSADGIPIALTRPAGGEPKHPTQTALARIIIQTLGTNEQLPRILGCIELLDQDRSKARLLAACSLEVGTGSKRGRPTLAAWVLSRTPPETGTGSARRTSSGPCWSRVSGAGPKNCPYAYARRARLGQVT
jgi:hypothetical protein